MTVTSEQSSSGPATLNVPEDYATIQAAVDAAAPGNNGANGVGLGNTRARLQQLYAGEHRLEAGHTDQGGFRVDIELPFRERDA